MIMNQRIDSLLPAAHIAAGGNGGSLDVRNLEGEVVLVLSAAATPAADNTLDVALEQSDDTVSWVPVSGVSFEQVTSAAPSHQEVAVNVDGLSRYLRGTDTLGGTAPEATRCLLMIGESKY